MESGYDRSISLLYQAALGTSSWSAALDALATLVDAWNVHLMGIDITTGIMQFSHEGGNPPPEGTLDYIQTWHRVDPRSELVMRGPENRWTHCHEHFDEAFVRSNPFYRDFLIPYGMRYISGVRFPPIGALTSVFSASRGVGRQPFDDRERALIARFGEHLFAALQMRASATTAVRHAMAGVAVLERISYPLLLIDAQRAILFRNEAARALLQRSSPLTDVDGGLRIVDRAQDARLTHLLKSIELANLARLVNDDGSPPPDRPVLVLPERGGENIVMHFARMTPGEVMGAFGQQELTLVTAFPVRSNVQVDPYVVQMVFGMTPAEARVASLAARGQRAEQIARSNGVSLATVRTQMRQAISKTGVAGQIELAALIGGNPLYWGGIAA